MIYLFLLFSFIIIFIIYSFLSSLFLGAPFLGTNRKKIKKILSFIPNNKKLEIVDLGSGDGRILTSLSDHGYKATGYEINFILFLYSIYKIRVLRSKNVKVFWKNMWNINLSEYDVVIVYGIPYIMKRLGTKLSKELKPGSIVISNSFPIPGWKPQKEKDYVYFYKV